MFCCLDIGTTDFPANRRREGHFINTSGTFAGGGGGVTSGAAPLHETVTVIVPFNKYGGEEMSVVAPKSGKTAMVMIPHALRPGEKFQVDIPVASTGTSPEASSPPPLLVFEQQGNQCADYNGFQYTHHQATQECNSHYTRDEGRQQIMSMPTPSAPPRYDIYSTSTPVFSHQQQSIGAFSNYSVAESSLSKPLDNSEKYRVLVKVPPGVAPGQTLEIKVPEDNNRILQVKVPHNIREFYVEYDPTNERSTGSIKNGADVDSRGRTPPANGGNAIDEAMIPILGGAALLGAAGLIIGHHNNGS